VHGLGTMIGAARLVMPEAVYFTLDQVAAILHKVRGLQWGAHDVN
jgi:hypothetical protein